MLPNMKLLYLPTCRLASVNERDFRISML